MPVTSGEGPDYLMQSTEICDGPARDDSSHCRVPHSVPDTFGMSALIRVRAHGDHRRAAASPVSIERRLTNPWMIAERHPAR